jgi:hypothetical protein
MRAKKSKRNLLPLVATAVALALLFILSIKRSPTTQTVEKQLEISIQK